MNGSESVTGYSKGFRSSEFSVQIINGLKHLLSENWIWHC